MGTYDKDLFVDREHEVDGFCRLLRRETIKAIWPIAAEKDMGKTWLIERLTEDCRASLGEGPDGEGMPAALAVVDFGNRYEVHEFQDTLSFVRLLRNKLDHPQFFGPLDDVIDGLTSAEEGTHLSAFSSLAKKMGDSFSLEALDILAADLDVDYENLPGGSVKQRKALELARELQRRGRMLQLIEKLEYERAHVDWRQGMEPLLGESSSPGTVAAAAPATGSYGPLRADSDRERQQAERKINEAFFACLKTLTAEVHPVILIFDAWEKAPAETTKWLKEELLGRVGCRELEQVVVLVAGRELPDLSELRDQELVVKGSSLDPFDEDRVGEFVQAYTAKYHLEITAEKMQFMREFSGGKPGKLAGMLEEKLAEMESQDPFFL
jgi:hypothetical protein